MKLYFLSFGRIKFLKQMKNTKENIEKNIKQLNLKSDKQY